MKKQKEPCYNCEYDCKEGYEKEQCKEYCAWVKKKEEAESKEQSEYSYEFCLSCIHCKHTEVFRDNTWFCNPKRQIILENTKSWLCNNQYYERRTK